MIENLKLNGDFDICNVNYVKNYYDSCKAAFLTPWPNKNIKNKMIIHSLEKNKIFFLNLCVLLALYI